MQRRTFLLSTGLLSTGLISTVLGLAGCAQVPPRPAPGPAEGVRDAATRAAEALASGADPGGVFTSSAPIAEIYAGMGELRPRVTVGEVLLDAVGERASTQLAYDWTIRVGQPAWEYTTPVTLLKAPDGDWRTEWTPQVVHLSLNTGDSLRARSLPAQRGEIIGANDERLVYRHAVVRVGLDLANVGREAALESARPLANQLAINSDRYYAKVAAAGPRAFVEAQVLRLTDPVHRDAINEVKKIPGVRLIDEERMLAVDPTFARPLLGTVGEATAEAILRSGGKVREGDIVGLSGLQASRDADLRGIPGYRVERRPSGELLAGAEPVRGSPLTVSLHRERQEEAEGRVARFSAPCALVLLRIADGHVLAAASGRGGEGFSTATLARLAVPVPPGGSETMAALGWDATASAGVPVVRGELSGDAAVASPLGVALAAASAASGKRVSPVIVVEGEPPPRPSLGAAKGDVAAWVDEIGRRRDWWVAQAEGWVAVGYLENGDAATLAADWISE